ncbi:MAG: cytochrome c, partial [Actinomycetota bacterium]
RCDRRHRIPGRGLVSDMTAVLTRALRVAAAPFIAASLFVACTDSTVEEADPADAGTAGDLGAEVYANSCASCHGEDLRGTDKGPSQLSIVYEPNHHTDDSYRSAITNGARQHHWSFGDMPPVEGLNQEEIEAVIGFIRAEQQRLGFER